MMKSNLISLSKVLKIYASNYFPNCTCLPLEFPLKFYLISFNFVNYATSATQDLFCPILPFKYATSATHRATGDTQDLRWPI